MIFKAWFLVSASGMREVGLLFERWSEGLVPILGGWNWIILLFICLFLFWGWAHLSSGESVSN